MQLSGGIIKRGVHDRQEVSPMRLDKPLTWAGTAQTPSINDTMTAHALKHSLRRTQRLLHTLAQKHNPSTTTSSSCAIGSFSDFPANLTVFQQIGGFNIRLVDFQSQMFFVQKNGLQCLKFVCDPCWIIWAWGRVCQIPVMLQLMVPSVATEFSRSPERLLLQLTAALGFLLRSLSGMEGADQLGWSREVVVLMWKRVVCQDGADYVCLFQVIWIQSSALRSTL